MDLLDRLIGHDSWTTQQVTLRCRDLDDAQLDRAFDIGPGSVRATLEHIIRNMEVWTDLIREQAVRPAGRSSIPELEARLERAAADLAALACEVREREAWDEEWVDVLDDPPRSKTYGGAIAHVITHSMHHRAQLLFMLRALGLDSLPEGDALSWERQQKK